MKNKFYKEFFLALFISLETYGNTKLLPGHYSKYNDYKNQFR